MYPPENTALSASPEMGTSFCRSAGYAVTKSFPATRFAQNSSREPEPGNRPSIPITAIGSAVSFRDGGISGEGEVGRTFVRAAECSRNNQSFNSDRFLY